MGVREGCDLTADDRVPERFSFPLCGRLTTVEVAGSSPVVPTIFFPCSFYATCVAFLKSSADHPKAAYIHFYYNARSEGQPASCLKGLASTTTSSFERRRPRHPCCAAAFHEVLPSTPCSLTFQETVMSVS
jgi:hypothetical protein